MFTSHDGLWSIGELAERAGVTVKAVRFYSDNGLLPEASRSAGGHRRYGPDALGRLRLLRSLRTLGLPVREVRRVLDEEGRGRAEYWRTPSPGSCAHSAHSSPPCAGGRRGCGWCWSARPVSGPTGCA